MGTNMNKINGVVTVMVSPMDKNGNPDKDGIHKLVNHLIGHGVAGIWLLGSTGEDINITRKNRLTIIDETVKAVDGRIPVLSGTGLMNTDEILEFIDDIGDIPLDGIHVIYRDTKQSDARMIESLTRLADKSRFPIWLYNNIKRGKPLSHQALEVLRHHPNIKGVKYGAFYHMPFIRAAMLETPDFQVMSAGNFFYSLLCYGGTASTVSDANCWPEEYVKLHRLYTEGKQKEARDLQYKLIELSSSFPRTDNGENCAEEKYILSLRGVCSEYVNSSYRILTDIEKKQYREILEAYGFDWV